MRWGTIEEEGCFHSSIGLISLNTIYVPLRNSITSVTYDPYNKTVLQSKPPSSVYKMVLLNLVCLIPIIK